MRKSEIEGVDQDSLALMLMWGQVTITNQTQGQLEQGNPAWLLVKNSVSGVELKADHEDETSTAPVPNPEK